MSLRSQTQDPQHKVPPGGLVLRNFKSWKNPLTSAGFEPANLGSRGEDKTGGKCSATCFIHTAPLSPEIHSNNVSPQDTIFTVCFPQFLDHLNTMKISHTASQGPHKSKYSYIFLSFSKFHICAHGVFFLFSIAGTRDRKYLSGSVHLLIYPFSAFNESRSPETFTVVAYMWQ